MITSYKEMTINKYQEIRQIIEEDGGELNIQARIIAALTGMGVDDVLNLSLTKYNEYVQKTAFLLEKPKLDGRIPNRLNINGMECEITKNVNKLTAAQYIDYQTLTAMKDQEKYLANILACFIVPKGKKYGDGYETDDIVAWIGENLSIVDGLNICFFFSKEVSELNKVYGNLFGIDDEEDGEEGEGPEDTDDDEGVEREADGVSETFARKWGWLSMVNEVSDITKLTWYQVFEMTVVEFLNICCYSRDKNNWEIAQSKKWQATH